ncbi:MAG TPA: DMT family transporter [Euzebyales bacterium]|nr:DMT family transporter [Euzebyales bacterium]
MTRVTTDVVSHGRAAARRYPLVLVSVGVVLYSTGPVMLQASAVSGPVFSFWRLWMGVGTLGAVAVVQRALGAPWPLLRAWRVAVWAGVAFGMHQLLFFTAIRMTTVVDVSLMNALAPIVTAVGARWMFGERPGPRFWTWAAVAIAGAVLLALAAAASPAGSAAGMTMALANVVFFAAFFLLSKWGRDHLPVAAFLLGTMSVAACVVSTFVLVTDAPVLDVRGVDLLLAGGVAVGPGAVGHFVMTWPLRYVPANIPPIMRLAQPFVAGGLAWWLLAEPLSLRHLVGGALVVAGAAGTVLSGDGRRLRADALRSAA